MKRLFVLACLVGFGCSANAEEAPSAEEQATAVADADASNTVTVSLSGLRSDEGVMLCALYNSEKTFLDAAKAVQGVSSGAPRDKAATCTFTGIKPGTYAVGAIHDENKNNKLDTNFIGIPKEGLGVSNDAPASFGPPKYKAAKFEYKGGALSLKITVRYL